MADSDLPLLNIYEIEMDGVPRHLVGFLDPVLAGARGIDTRAMVGEFEPLENGEFDLETFEVNPEFVETFTRYMNERRAGRRRSGPRLLHCVATGSISSTPATDLRATRTRRRRTSSAATRSTTRGRSCRGRSSTTRITSGSARPRGSRASSPTAISTGGSIRSTAPGRPRPAELAEVSRMAVRLLALSGSLRAGSSNGELLRAAALLAPAGDRGDLLRRPGGPAGPSIPTGNSTVSRPSGPGRRRSPGPPACSSAAPNMPTASPDRSRMRSTGSSAAASSSTSPSPS